MTDRRHRLAVLASGNGSNLQAIIDASTDPAYLPEVVVVISDRPGARALERAAAAGIPTELVPWRGAGERPGFTRDLVAAAESHGVGTLILAGFVRILSPSAVERFPSGILNIHPSLLPAFPGTIHAVKQAVTHGVKLTGVTVHYVDAGVDSGPIIYQEAVPVLADDTTAALHERIQRVEHRVYPDVIEVHAMGRLEVVGRAVVWTEEST